MTYVIALACVAACGRSTDATVEEPPITGLAILSGGGVTDTALARLAAPLVVELRDSTGQLAPNITIRFVARDPFPLTTPPSSAFRVAKEATSEPVATLDVLTDANGQAKVFVRFGVSAGVANVSIYASLIVKGATTSATYTVEPGAVAKITVTPPDTSVGFGNVVLLTTATTDAHGNPRAAKLATVSSGPITHSDGIVTALSTMGLGRVIVAAGSVADTTFVSVVAPIRVAAIQEGGALVLLSLDAGGVRKVLQSSGSGSYRRVFCWNSTGSRVLLERGGVDGNRLVSIDTNGNKTEIATQAINAGEEYPSCVRSRNAVWFSASDTRQSMPGLTIWRMNNNGSSLEQVGPNNTNNNTPYTHPSPSPDEQRAVFLKTTYPAGDILHVLDRRSGTPVVTDLGIRSWAPRWSPTEDLIVFGTPSEGSTLSGPIWAMRPDGTERRQVSAPGHYYLFDFDFTPDGKWLLTQSGPKLALVNFQTGERLLISNTANLRLPAIRP